MTWFKVDDKFHSHRKIAALGTDTAALALWVVAGSWSADQLTDGWIPEYIVPRLLPVSKTRAFRFASALELCGLWDRSEPDSEPGWQFHGWNERGRQPTAAQVLADREANAVRQAAFQERKKADRNGVDNGVMNGVANKAPSRPVPSSTKDDSLRSSSTARKRASPTARGTRIPDDFEITDTMRQWGRENVPGIVDPVGETDAFVDYWRAQPGQRGVKVDWEATWRNWMRKAVERGIGTGHRAAQQRPATSDLRAAQGQEALGRLKQRIAAGQDPFLGAISSTTPQPIALPGIFREIEP